MIEIHQLTRRFGDFCAVDRLSFSVAPGEILGFLGPNGAGKSTTMKMLTGFLTPTEGSVKICGFDIEKQPLEAKRLIGYLPEGAPSYNDMTVLQFLDFMADMRGLAGEQKSQRLKDVIAQVQLDEVLHKTVDTLSKGFKRRVGLAQAIMHDPKVLILDEPTDGLDPNQKQQVRELILNMAKDKIIIISTHILEEVTAVCTRAIIIAHGKLLSDDSPQDLLARSPRHGAVRLQMAHTPEHVAALKSLSSVRDVEHLSAEQLLVLPRYGATLYADISELIKKEKWPVGEMFAEQGRLDDVFREITLRA
ncbi:ABC transporter ATP-binding protein [Permianibacter aggregans]|uniref:ABC-2 type transport system ATP-binding protein n=1 Tax=Permianibacter aggregans TaxID=1510150 RepID=A0A4R6UMF2_9GAMM|nr:ABC transporter ATP-binding protein [Permianibacter aggregans]QGX40909.1 ABC transporter ATP-binding protein [Permianibacter aggregans]TDQ48270.1 ABC-2 type transport system ATP-binding protein [Permianibacter aggregans]